MAITIKSKANSAGAAADGSGQRVMPEASVPSDLANVSIIVIS